jgi:hypothetical protein
MAVHGEVVLLQGIGRSQDAGRCYGFVATAIEGSVIAAPLAARKPYASNAVPPTAATGSMIATANVPTGSGTLGLG